MKTTRPSADGARLCDPQLHDRSEHFVMRDEKPSTKAFNQTESQSKMREDFDKASGRILIVSAYASVNAVKNWRPHLKRAIGRGVAICAFIQAPRYWDQRHDNSVPEDDFFRMKQLENAVELLQSFGVHVTLRPLMHEKLVVVDDCILWEGSMNILSWFETTERFRRTCDPAEVVRAIEKHRLLACEHCKGPTISEVLAERRSSLKLSQEELATKAGTYRQLIGDCESGKRTVRLTTLTFVCDVLGLEVQVVPQFLSRQRKQDQMTIPGHTLSGGQNPVSPTISQLVAERRRVLRLSKAGLGRITGTNRRLVREFEAGTRDVRLETLERICRVLGLEIQVIPKPVE